jgi:hypothetical protein
VVRYAKAREQFRRRICVRSIRAKIAH